MNSKWIHSQWLNCFLVVYFGELNALAAMISNAWERHKCVRMTNTTTTTTTTNDDDDKLFSEHREKQNCVCTSNINWFTGKMVISRFLILSSCDENWCVCHSIHHETNAKSHCKCDVYLCIVVHFRFEDACNRWFYDACCVNKENHFDQNKHRPIHVHGPNKIVCGVFMVIAMYVQTFMMREFAVALHIIISLKNSFN